MTKKKLLFFLIVFLDIFLFFLLIKTRAPAINKNGLKDYIPPKKEYSLFPLNGSAVTSTTSVTYPPVEIFPKDKMYFLVNIEKKFNLIADIYDYLYFSSFKIAELGKWGSKLNWTPFLNEYTQLIKNQISKLKNKCVGKLVCYDSISNFRLTLNSHFSYLQAIIFGSDKNYPEKIKLQKIITDLFEKLNKDVDKNFFQYDPYKLKYALANLITEKEYGIYDIHINTLNIPIEIQKEIKLEVANKLYAGIIDEQNNDLIFKDVSLTKSNFSTDSLEEYINLHLPKVNLTKNPWIQDFKDSTLYRYVMKVDKLNPSTKYYIKFKYNIEEPITLKFIQEFKEKNQPDSQYEYLMDELIFPHDKNFIVNKHIQTGLQNRDYYGDPYFLISSKRKIPEEELASMDIDYAPVYEPEITLLKISSIPNLTADVSFQRITNFAYLIKTFNTSADQENFIYDSLGFGWKKIENQKVEYQPHKTILNLLYLSISFLIIILFLFKKNNIVLRIKKPIIQLCEKILNHFKSGLRLLSFIIGFIKKIIVKLKYIFLLIAISGFIFDISFLQSYYNTYELFIMLIWILIIIGFDLDSSYSLFLTLFFLFLSPFLIYKKMDLIAEKANTWAYLLLIIAFVQLLIEVFIAKKEASIVKVCTNFISNYPIIINSLNYISSIIKKIARFVLSILIIPVNLFKISFKKIYIKSSKKYIEYTVNTLINFIIISLFVLFIITARHEVIIIGNKIERDKKIKFRNSLDPKITKVEPTIAYRSIKIIIFGKNFGWNLNSELRLMRRSGEKIIPELINDTKIIFSIPLSWNYGNNTLWIEKDINWEGKKIITKTPVFNIKIIPAGSSFTKDDDAFFEQLKTLNKETRDINGYD